MKKINRKAFFQIAGMTSIAVTLQKKASSSALKAETEGKKIGIIGLDTSHSPAFVKLLSQTRNSNKYGGYYIYAAYPYGSKTIPNSFNRIPGFIDEVKKYDVIITNTLEELIDQVDVVMLETNDGNLHLEQATAVIKAGKKLFIDKPIAASYKDAVKIFELAEQNKVPIFSSSSLRYLKKVQELIKGNSGKILGADTYSPATLEKSHPDFFWYGIHGIEILFTLLGTGCKTVSRAHTEDYDIVTGIWEDGRIGVFRGTRKGPHDYGGVAFTEKENVFLGKYEGYEPLLQEIIQFFETGNSPIKKEETLEICAFIEAADKSKKRKGRPVHLHTIQKK